MNSVVIKSVDRDIVESAVMRHVANLRQQYPEIQKAIWFGSWIHGIPTPGSDVDLCLILDSSSEPYRDRIPNFLPVGFPVGIDVFPYTQEEFDRLKTNHLEWYREILSGREM